MVSERSIHVAVNTVAFLLLYSLLAGWVGDALSLSTFTGGILGMVGSVAVFAVLDGLEAALGGDPFLGEGSRLHAVRGLFVLYLFFLVTTGAAGALDANTALPAVVVVLAGALVATLVVFGPLVGYYYRRSLDGAAAT